jgi:hypothetical protein
MGWEDRNGRLYYYRKRREGRRVISEYLGNSVAAELSSMLDWERRHRCQRKSRGWKTQKAQVLGLERSIMHLGVAIDAIAAASLMLSGFHTHKGQWRKGRNA